MLSYFNTSKNLFVISKLVINYLYYCTYITLNTCRLTSHVKTNLAQTQTFCLQVVKDAYNIYTVFWGFATFSFLGLAFMLLMLPETKGKSFACIQAQLKREVARDNAKKLATVEY